VVALYRWLTFVLSQLPYTRPWGEQLLGFFNETGSDLARAEMAALPDLATAALILLTTRAAIGIVTPFLDRVAEGHTHVTWLDPDTAGPTRQIAVLGIRLFGLVMAYPYIPGSQTEAFKGISVLLGLMVTFGGPSFAPPATDSRSPCQRADDPRLVSVPAVRDVAGRQVGPRGQRCFTASATPPRPATTPVERSPEPGRTP